MFFDKLDAFVVNENGTFAADGFGNEEGTRFGAGGGRVVETSGMELNEFHIGNGRAGPPTHGESVAGRRIRIGGIEVGFSATTGGENNARRGDGLDFVGLDFENVGPEDAVVGHRAKLAGGDEINGVVVFENGDVCSFAGSLDERGGDFASGGVFSVKDASV